MYFVKLKAARIDISEIIRDIRDGLLRKYGEQLQDIIDNGNSC